jgi:isoquinoline 1-oxidoreductase beta subunit
MTAPAIQISRRHLLRYTAAAGALVITTPLVSCGRPQESEAMETPRGEPVATGPFVAIRPDESVVIGFPNPEMGQGVDTSLAMLVAEELGVDFDRVEVEQMPLGIMLGDDGNITWKNLPQGSGGSTSVSGNWEPLRKAGAMARMLLIAAAAEQWDVPASELQARDGTVSHQASNRSATYGELAKSAGAIDLGDAEPQLMPKEKFRIIGKPQKMKNARAIVTGQPLFGIDAELPGMLHAVVARCPYFDGLAKTVDDSAARAIPGVRDVIKIDRPPLGGPYDVQAEGYAVVADNLWAAMKGREALAIEWDSGPFADESSAGFKRHCAKLLEGKGQIVRNDGNFDAAAAAADEMHEATYWQPYVSHAPLEPQNCIADVRSDGVDIVGPMQMPSSANREVAAALGIDDRLSISVVPTRLGGGFGRRLSSDYAVEAALISKAVGKPVKLLWTRDDDLRHDFFRPSGMHQLKAAFDAEGNLTAWTHRLASASKYYRRPNLPETDYWQAELYPDNFPGNLVDNYRVEYFSAKSGAPRGSWRAPAHTANAFVVETFLDEIAARRREDPLALRLRILGEDRELPYEQHGGPTFNPGRLAHVLKLAAEKGGFGQKMPVGQGRGIACHFTFGGYVAQVVDVAVDAKGGLKVLKVVGAVDIGQIVNPNGVRAQHEGAINDGLSTALRLAINIEGGRVTNGNFDSYPLMKIADAPPVIETHIVGNDYPPSGMGEMGLPPLAPALGNAIFAATGKRIRELPIGNQLA